MTFPRMDQLAEVHMWRDRWESFRFGIAVNAAMSDDAKNALWNILFPKKPVTEADVPPMLRQSRNVPNLPKKQRK